MKKWFENLKISSKLTNGFLVVALLGVIIGVVGIFSIIRMNASKGKKDRVEPYPSTIILRTSR